MSKSSLIYLFLLFSIIISLLLVGYSFLAPEKHPFFSFLLYWYPTLMMIVSLLFLFLLKKDSHVQVKPAENATDSDTDVALRYKALLDNIGEGLLVTDRTGKITTYNKAAQSILGWSEQEALGKSINDIIIIDYKSSKENTTAPGHHSPIYFMRKDKTNFPVDLTGTSYVQGTNVLGTITLFRDITDEVNMDRMKDEFISLASHQLRTPLSAIRWYTDMLIKGDVGQLLPEQKEYAEVIYSSTIRMNDLVTALLNLSRIESGRVIIEPKPTDIKKLAEDVLNEVKIRFEQKQHTYTVTAEDSLPLVNLDPGLIRQVYLNLLTNSSKYTPEKGQISIKIFRKDNDIISEVQDTGYGIPENDQDKIFNKFYRAENAVKEVNDGTGLGLYFIKNIMNLSQGKIWFKSEIGKGTTFWFSLPISGTPPKKGVVRLD